MDDVSKFMGRELFTMLCGKMLGSGEYRAVYECALIPDHVVKIEDRSKSFSNALEWEYWNKFRDIKGIGNWLAPCVDISAAGSILIQRRVKRMRLDEMPRTMPEFLQDFKVENYGMLDGRVVCCDYAGITIAAGARKAKVQWWTHAGGRVEQ